MSLKNDEDTFILSKSLLNLSILAYFALSSTFDCKSIYSVPDLSDKKYRGLY